MSWIPWYIIFLDDDEVIRDILLNSEDLPENDFRRIEVLTPFDMNRLHYNYIPSTDPDLNLEEIHNNFINGPIDHGDVDMDEEHWTKYCKKPFLKTHHKNVNIFNHHCGTWSRIGNISDFFLIYIFFLSSRRFEVQVRNYFFLKFLKDAIHSILRSILLQLLKRNFSISHLTQCMYYDCKRNI